MTLKKRLLVVGMTLAIAGVAVAATVSLGAAGENVNYADLAKIKAEGMQRSQVMELCSWLSDVYAPRLTGSPMAQKGADWTVAKMKEYGLTNVKIEPWVNRNGFERGWTNDKFYMAFSSADGKFPIPGTPTAWTPGTNGLVTGGVVLVAATTEEELATFKGKLRGKWILTQAVPDVAAYWDPIAKRYTTEQLQTMELQTPPPLEFGVTPPGAGRGGPGGAPQAAQPGQRGAAAAPAQPGQRGAAAAPAATPAQPAPAGGRGGQGAAAARAAFFFAEGALGTISTAPRGHGIYTIGGNRNADPAATLPAVAIAAEQYNRVARMLAKNVAVTIEAEIKNTFYPNPAVFNIVGELPGTDKADEIVMLGGHFDTWHAATGATDDNVGVAAMMEAMRILKATGVKLRRTVRIGLWEGEEQGLIGSREYVAAHFASRQALPAAPGAPAAGAAPAGGGGRGGPQGPLELKPDYDKLSVYFNIDNGTGALRGVYLQGNEAVAPIFREWMEPFRALGMTTLTIRRTSGTDHLSFDNVGLPGFQFIQDEIEYNAMTHHTNLDTYERLQPNDVTRMATIAAGFAYLAANRDEKLPRNPLPPPGQGGRGRGGQ
ncbi:MAG: M20/M25/M40 family metallo-hydrolase [Acidobacteria bacterium]|nr:M20/M25/M40 family metallo-hydrolase [Acidobacteriota bacterium]